MQKPGLWLPPRRAAVRPRRGSHRLAPGTVAACLAPALEGHATACPCPIAPGGLGGHRHGREVRQQVGHRHAPATRPLQAPPGPVERDARRPAGTGRCARGGAPRGARRRPALARHRGRATGRRSRPNTSIRTFARLPSQATTDRRVHRHLDGCQDDWCVARGRGHRRDGHRPAWPRRRRRLREPPAEGRERGLSAARSTSSRGRRPDRGRRRRHRCSVAWPKAGSSRGISSRPTPGTATAVSRGRAERQHAGRKRIEGAGVADSRLSEGTPHNRDHIVDVGPAGLSTTRPPSGRLRPASADSCRTRQVGVLGEPAAMAGPSAADTARRASS